MENTSAKPFHWTMGGNHGIKRRNWKILPHTDCSGHLKIPGNSQSWNMLVGFLWDAQLRAGWSEEAAKPCKALLKKAGELSMWVCLVKPKQSELCRAGPEPRTQQSWRQMLPPMVCLPKLCFALLLPPSQCSHPTHWPFPHHLQSY